MTRSNRTVSGFTGWRRSYQSFHSTTPVLKTTTNATAGQTVPSSRLTSKATKFIRNASPHTISRDPLFRLLRAAVTFARSTINRASRASCASRGVVSMLAHLSRGANFTCVKVL
ncbi:MAG: hypothetical protein C5B60_00565 [Chloroflexi bacterium]|nr:MAG: hypothetical protein C5B60_00565 [Chloroflexota bacterium]